MDKEDLDSFIAVDDLPLPMPPKIPPNRKGPIILHTNPKRQERKAVCASFGITMKQLRKQTKAARRAV